MNSILLVEDEPDTRQWLARQLSDSFPEVMLHSCACLQEALHWMASHRADVVLTDLNLPDGSGLEVIRCAMRWQPPSDVLVLSMFGDERHVLAALDAGANGYLLKDGSESHLREHLACLKQGGSPLSPSIARTLIRRHQGLGPSSAQPAQPEGDTDQAAVLPTLSAREVDVLTGVAKGFSYGEVADMLGMSTNTVRTHIRHIYDKLSVNSRSEALLEYNRRRSAQGLPPIR
jgi:DNA-binding NarL/FixJ family response regulator